MKRIVLLSDTHAYVDDDWPQFCQGADEIWHAGDIGSMAVIDALEALAPVRAVHGNIDGGALRQRFPEDLFFHCEDVPVWMTHIGGYPGRYARRVREYLQTHHPPRLFICGHSHILKVMHDPRYNMLHMNPGAAGIQGFHRVKTLLRFSVEGDRITNLEAVELGPRAGMPPERND